MIKNYVTRNGKEYLALNNDGSIIYSENGINWSVTNKPQFYISDIIWTGYRYILVGDYAIITAVPKDIIKVLVNGKPIIFDVAPEIKNDSTLVPARYVFETLGADVQWDEEMKIITIKGNEKEIKLKINDKIAYVNSEAVQLDAAPVIVNGRTLIPLRFVAESFNAEVNWDQDTKTVNIKY